MSCWVSSTQPSSKHFTATIAGPHQSFNMLAGKVGNVAFLLQKFKEGLEFWNDAGEAPAPKSLDMTDEERGLAYFINKFDAAICASDCVE